MKVETIQNNESRWVWVVSFEGKPICISSISFTAREAAETNANWAVEKIKQL